MCSLRLLRTLMCGMRLRLRGWTPDLFRVRRVLRVRKVRQVRLVLWVRLVLLDLRVILARLVRLGLMRRCRLRLLPVWVA